MISNSLSVLVSWLFASCVCHCKLGDEMMELGKLELVNGGIVVLGCCRAGGESNKFVTTGNVTALILSLVQ